MGNILKIKRGEGVPNASKLLPYELGWSTTSKELYINDNGEIVIAGNRNFLPLDGGTLTGDLTINCPNFTALTVNKTVDNNLAGICFSSNGDINGYITINNSNKACLYDEDYAVKSAILFDTRDIIPIANGGTGAMNAAEARNNLGLGNTDGALPIANGGTGATTAAGARNNLGLGNTIGALPVANGGTGSTTPEAARNALGITPENIGALPVGYRSNSVWNGNLNAYINVNGHWLPGNTAQQLGSSGVRWNYVCLAHNPDVSSDRRLKANINSDMSKYVEMLEHLSPCAYTIKADNDGIKHAGYIAQEVEEALEAVKLNAEDFGGFVYHAEEDNYALRYEEFIPVLHAAVIALSARVKELESRLKPTE